MRLDHGGMRENDVAFPLHPVNRSSFWSGGAAHPAFDVSSDTARRVSGSFWGSAVGSVSRTFNIAVPGAETIKDDNYITLCVQASGFELAELQGMATQICPARVRRFTGRNPQAFFHISSTAWAKFVSGPQNATCFVITSRTFIGSLSLFQGSENL